MKTVDEIEDLPAAVMRRSALALLDPGALPAIPRSLAEPLAAWLYTLASMVECHIPEWRGESASGIGPSPRHALAVAESIHKLTMAGVGGETDA